MNLGLKLSLATAGGGQRMDADAAAFIAATGATDTAAIDAWVRGIKDAGIWDNMVCWPMRSQQNHGSGTTLRSLGGLGNYPGTLVNGPTWGANGITCTHGSGQSVSVSLPLDFPFTGMIVRIEDFTAGSSGATNDMGAPIASAGSIGLFTMNSILARRYSFRLKDDGANKSLNYSASSPYCAFTKIQNTTQQVFVNASASPANSFTETMGDIENKTVTQLLGLSTMTDFSGTLQGPFSCYFNVAVDTAAIYALYKSTLGAGLGLP